LKNFKNPFDAPNSVHQIFLDVIRSCEIETGSEVPEREKRDRNLLSMTLMKFPEN